MDTGAFVDLGNTTIPAGITRIRTSSYASGSTLGAAFYIEDTAQTPWSAQGTTLRTAAINQGRPAADVDAALLASESRWRRQDASGRWFRLSRSQPIVAEMFGAVPDAVYTAAQPWNARWAGTDNTPAFQAMFDWAIYFGGSSKLSDGGGIYRFGSTVHIGYGDRTAAVTYAGTGEGYRFLSQGTCFARNFCGQPLFNIQWARHVRIGKLRTFGTQWEYIRSKGLGVIGTPMVDDLNPNNWNDPEINTTLGRSPDARYAPDGAFVIDGYCGIRPQPPEASYANVAYPAWLGAASQTQYNKGQSSDVLLTRILYHGEINGDVVQPSNFDGNGDFVRAEHISAEYCKRIRSIGGNQARTSGISYCVASGVYEIVTTTTHGRQNGRIDSNLEHITVSGGIQLFSIGSTGIAGAIKFSHCYVEAFYRIGTVIGGSNAENAITFQDCHLNFGLQGLNAHGIPATILSQSTGVATTLTPIVFIGGYVECGGFSMINAHVAVYGGTLFSNEIGGQQGDQAYDATGTLAGRASYDNQPEGFSYRATDQVPWMLYFRVGAAGGWTAGKPFFPAYLASVHNGSSGGVLTAAVLATGTQRRTFDARFTPRNIDTGGAAQTIQLGESYKTGQRAHCIPFMAQSVSPTTDATGVDRIIPPTYIPVFNKNTIISVGPGLGYVNNDAGGYIEWTFDTTAYTATSGWRLEFDGGAKGDIYIDTDTLMQWVCTTATPGAPTRIVLRSLNNIKVVDGIVQFITQPSTGTGLLRMINCRRYTPPLPMMANHNTTDGAATGVGQDDGTKLTAGDVQVGDRLYVNRARDNWIAEVNSRITAIDLPNGTMSLAGPALKAGVRRHVLVSRTVA